MRRITCEHEGCEETSPLYRTSPKGGPFRGKCPDHYDGQLDPLVQAIANDGKKPQ